MVTAGLGIWCGILYRSFTEQLADDRRWAGYDAFVLAVKGALLVLVIAGLVDAVRAERLRSPHEGCGPLGST